MLHFTRLCNTAKVKQPSGAEIHNDLENSTRDPLEYTMESHIMYGKISENNRNKQYFIWVIMFYNIQWRSQNDEKLRTSKGNCWIKQLFNSIVPLLIMGTSLKEKNLLPDGTISFLQEPFLMAFTT